MKEGIAAFVVSLGLAAAPAFADEANAPTKKPEPKAVKMSDAQLDNVTAGALLNVVAVDVVDVNNNRVPVAVNIPVNAAVAIAVLGGALSTATQAQPGRIVQNLP